MRRSQNLPLPPRIYHPFQQLCVSLPESALGWKGGGIFWEGGVYSGSVAHRCLKWGILWEGGLYYGSVKKGGIFWERGVNSGRVAYRCLKEGGVHSGREGGREGEREGGREGGVDSESVTLYKRGYILGGRGRFWDCRI